jgi:TetR/AcrR family transcriptional repressor of nem operon
LRSYLDLITSKLEAENFARGCMIGNLSLETVVHSEQLRLRLVSIFERWREPFADCIAEGQSAGEISTDFTPLDLADFLLSSWQGAMLRMKVERSPEPLERFKRIIFATTFREVQT